MRPLLTALLLMALATVPACGQGQFIFGNAKLEQTRLYTRLGTIDGPFAGPGIWAQMLVGDDANSLMPVGMSAEHLDGYAIGIVAGGVISLSDRPPFSTVYVQMVAWDGDLWGVALDGVPEDQLGRTDIVPHELAHPDFGPVTSIPAFHQPAIVPIPEPSTLALAVLAGIPAAWLLRRGPGPTGR